MKKQDYSKYILAQLGGDIVDIELADKIETFVDLALIQVKPYIGTTKYLTLPANRIIDISDKGIYNVVTIYRGSAPASSGTGMSSSMSDDAIIFQGSANMMSGFMDMSLVDSIAINLLTQQVINTANGYSSDIDFTQKDGKLYVELGNASCQDITLEYIPLYDDVEQVTEPYWENFIMRLALANTKIALGRARGKYRVSNLSYELDADTILSEGTQELEALTTKLEEMSDDFYVLD